MEDIGDPYAVEFMAGDIRTLLRQVAHKHGLKPQDLWFKRKVRQPDYITEARAEFCYEAYKTGKYGYHYIAEALRNRGKWRRQVVCNIITRYCKENDLERPTWGIRTRPWYRCLGPNESKTTTKDTEKRRQGL